MMKRPTVACCLVAAMALAVATSAEAQGSTKKELVQRILQIQQVEIEAVARTVVERPAAQMMQEASVALRQVAPDKREALGKALEAEAKKYIDESYPLVRERAVRIAPATIGAVLEEKLSDDELKQLLAWLESPANKKYQQLGPDMRNSFIQKLLADARPVVDPKLQALEARARVILGMPAAAGAASAAQATKPPAARASGK